MTVVNFNPKEIIISLQNVTHEDLQKVVGQLEQALHNHQQWFAELNRTLICHLPPDQHDINPEGFKLCRFGQWYYNYADPNLKDHPGFIAIGDEHCRMHGFAAHLLIATAAGTPIIPRDYDNFANSIQRLQLEISTLNRELEGLLYSRDPLTGAINRTEMLSVLREQQELIKRQVVKACCIAMMDIDHFKKINDQYGHSAGDKVLASLAHYVMDNLRPYDKLFRYGGEEFLLCIQNLELTSGEDMLERLLKRIAAQKIDIDDNKPIQITASFGLTLLDPNAPVEQSIDHADKALYAAKNAGRNCLKIWEPEIKVN